MDFSPCPAVLASGSLFDGDPIEAWSGASGHRGLAWEPGRLPWLASDIDGYRVSREDPPALGLEARTPSGSKSLRLNQLDLVAVRIFGESDDGCAVFHRSGLTSHLSASGFNLLTGRVGVVDRQGNVTKTIP